MALSKCTSITSFRSSKFATERCSRRLQRGWLLLHRSRLNVVRTSSEKLITSPRRLLTGDGFCWRQFRNVCDKNRDAGLQALQTTVVKVGMVAVYHSGLGLVAVR